VVAVEREEDEDELHHRPADAPEEHARDEPREPGDREEQAVARGRFLEEIHLRRRYARTLPREC